MDAVARAIQRKRGVGRERLTRKLLDGTATDCNKKESIEKWNRIANDGKID